MLYGAKHNKHTCSVYTCMDVKADAQKLGGVILRTNHRFPNPPFQARIPIIPASDRPPIKREKFNREKISDGEHKQNVGSRPDIFI